MEIFKSKNSVYFKTQGDILFLLGNWSSRNLVEIQDNISLISKSGSHIKYINGEKLKNIDINTVIMLSTLVGLDDDIVLENFSTEHENIWHKALSFDFKAVDEQAPEPNLFLRPFIALGIQYTIFAKAAYNWFAFLGTIFIAFIHILKHPKVFRWKSLSNQIYSVAARAAMIIILISFSIAIVIAILIHSQLEIFNMGHMTTTIVVIAMLREMAVLLTAIMVAGRTGASFAAEIGIMNMTEETSAIRIMGFDFENAVILPRVLGTIIGLTILTIIADIASLLASYVFETFMLKSSTAFFFNTMHGIDLLYYFNVGIVKAPVYGLVISSIGCFYGINCKSSTHAIAAATTKSVVTSVFLVIIGHAIFALIFDMLGI